MLTVLLILSCGALLLWRLCSKPARFPPGPFRWPLVGNMLDFKGSQPHLVMWDYSRRFGNVVGFYLGGRPVVLVSGLEAVREAMGRAELQARPHRQVDTLDDERYGVLFTDGPSWQELRRFSLRYLRDLGVGRRHIETLLHAEARALLEDVRRLAGHDCSAPVPVRELVSAVGTNVILHLMAGERLERDDPRFPRLIGLMKRLTRLTNVSGGLTDAFPPLIYLWPSITEYPIIKAFRSESKQFISEFITKHEARLGQGEPTDYLDYFLAEMDKRDAGDITFNEKQLLGICKDLFLAGSDTTSGALSLALLYMVLHPVVQTKVQRELDSVVGSGRLPGMDDRQRLPYVEATLLETLRMGNVVPLAVPHAASPEAGVVEFKGYSIPRGATVLLNLFALHMDPEYWGDPDIFRPERFLDAGGRVRSDEALLPFGAGKRSCLGESLARSNLLVAFSALMLHYSFSTPEGALPPSIQPYGGITLSAADFSVAVRPRV